MALNKKNISVLIIDDDNVTRLLLRHILVVVGYAVLGEAVDGESGLEMAKQLHPDIICLDVVMPSSSGLDVLKQIKHHLPRTIVLMVTGNNDRETVMSALQTGADGYIIKPFDSVKLIQTVENAFIKSRGLAYEKPVKERLKMK